MCSHVHALNFNDNRLGCAGAEAVASILMSMCPFFCTPFPPRGTQRERDIFVDVRTAKNKKNKKKWRSVDPSQL